MRYVSRIERPTIFSSSSPSLGRWMPVAIRIVIFSRVIPACSRVSNIGGRITLFGTGRVTSEITIHADSRPFAISANGDEAIGCAIACRTAPSSSGSGTLSEISRTPATFLSGISIGNVPVPYRISTRILTCPFKSQIDRLNTNISAFSSENTLPLYNYTVF